MARSVLLRHALPDGSFHFDWLIELPLWGEHRLLTLRIDPPVDPALPPAPIDPGLPSFRAVLLPLHRAAYLEHQGPVSRGRGDVRPVASGEAWVRARTRTQLHIESALAEPARLVRASREHPGDDFRCVSSPVVGEAGNGVGFRVV